MSNAPHILVIDDEPQILRAIRTILTEKQFRVTTANRGEEGLTLAATSQPDLIILDLGLPDMDGVEVCTRLRVALRHSASRNAAQGAQSKIVKAGSLAIDLAWHIVKRGDEEVKLTGTEYKLLAYLAANHGRVLTHQSILTHVWGEADADHTEYLRVYMRQLRKKLEVDPERPQYILTEPGIGYRFITDE